MQKHTVNPCAIGAADLGGSSVRIISLVYQGTVYSKKNSKRIIRNRRTGKMSIISSEQAQANEDDMVSQFKKQYDRTVQSPCNINIVIFEPNYTRRDLDNQVTSVLDALKTSGIIEDDDFKHVKDIRVKFGGVDRKNPRVMITIMW